MAPKVIVLDEPTANIDPASAASVAGLLGLEKEAAEELAAIAGLHRADIAKQVGENDEVLVVMEKGNIVRSRVDGVKRTGRNTMGVAFAAPRTGDSIVAVARSVEQVGDEQVDAVASGDDVPAEAADGSTNDAEQTAGGTE